MKLPQGYKRWVRLIEGEMCANLWPTGRVPDVAFPCHNKAVEVVALLDAAGELFQWLPLCSSCLERHKDKPDILRRSQWLEFRRACRNAKVSPEFAEKCINEQYGVAKDV